MIVDKQNIAPFPIQSKWKQPQQEPIEEEEYKDDSEEETEEASHPLKQKMVLNHTKYRKVEIICIEEPRSKEVNGHSTT